MCTNVHIILCCSCYVPSVNIPALLCKYVLYLLAILQWVYICTYTSPNASRPVLLDEWGPKGPLFKNPSRVFLHIDDSSWLNKIASTIIFGPMVLMVNRQMSYLTKLIQVGDMQGMTFDSVFVQAYLIPLKTLFCLILCI